MNLDCFDNNDIRRMTTMKKYTYTESTDLIIYDQKPKKEKKQNFLTGEFRKVNA